MSISIVVAPAISIDPPEGPMSFLDGTGLPTSVWQFPGFNGTVAAFDTAVGSTAPNATFLTNSVNYPLSSTSTPTTLQNFVGSSGSDFTGTALASVERTYFILSGYIELSTNAALSIPFRLHSDDGSQLFLGDVQVINNDGIHGFNTVSGTAEFSQSGLYPIELKYFNNGNRGGLLLTYDPTNTGTFINIPTSALFSSLPINAVPEPATAALCLTALVTLALVRRKTRPQRSS